MKTIRFRLLSTLVLGSTVMLGACSSVNQLLGKEEPIDYKTANKDTRNPLQIPPDLTQLAKEERYSVPGSGSTSYSSYANQNTNQPNTTKGEQVATQRADMRVVRDGSQRWLNVDNLTPEQVYPLLREFWQDLGFQLRIDQPTTGIMETDWAENRAKLPQDFIRSTIGKVFDSLYSTGELDKFRTRVERNVQGGTDIFISHQGMVEELIGSSKDQTKWTNRPNDPELEAEFLRRLMVRLGAAEDKARYAVANPSVENTSPAVQRTDVSGSGAAGALQVAEPFDRAWRRVGLALDRSGFTVEDRNRSDGIYYVRYADDQVVNTKDKEKGFFSRLFSFGGGNTQAKDRPMYRVRVIGSGSTSTITVEGKEGETAKTATTTRILDLLLEQLKQ